MKIIFTILTLLPSLFAQSQKKAHKVDSIYFNLYTDSLKKGVYNYINVDGMLANGNFEPLTSSQVSFSSSYGKWDGNNLILEREAKVDSVIINAVLISDSNIKKSKVIYLKKIEIEPELKTEKELLEEWQRKGRKKSKKFVA